MRVGTSFRHSRYEILRLLGQGGMGRVFLARDLMDDGRRVALKLYPAQCHHERLREEFLTLRELRHPAIARALNFGRSETDGAPFFTLEYVQGVVLPDWFAPAGEPARGAAAPDRRKGAPPCTGERLESILWLLTAVTAATAYLHRRSLLHLDIKPDNILVIDLGPGLPPQPVLIDFGLVHSVESVRESPAHGTLPYMAPELFQGSSPTPAADVYALAATFYRALSGRYPVAGTDFDSFARAHKASAAAPIPEAPPELAKLLLRALAKSPRQRFRSAGEFHRALTRPSISRHLGALASRSAVVYHEPEFVGREREIAELGRWIGGDRRSAPIFEVRGGGGWGKTRFLEKARTCLEVEGRRVLHLEGEGFRGTSLLRRGVLFTELLHGKPSGQRPRARPGGRGPRDSASPASTPEDAEGREILARKLVTRLQPLLAKDTFLVLDDLHLADRHELEAVTTLARGLASAPEPPGGGILVARRRPEDGPDPLQEWTDAGLCVAIEMGSLARKEALQIDLEGLDGALADVSPETARKLKTDLHRHVGGHPLFYVRGLLDLTGDRSAAGSLEPTEALIAQVESLDETLRKTALCIACIGRPTTLPELVALLPENRKSLASATQRLRRAGILAIDDDRVRVIHDSVRDTILRSCPESERRAQHERLAAVLSRRDGDEVLVEVAWHLLAAGLTKDALARAGQWIDAGLQVPGRLAGQGLDLLSRAADCVGARTREGARFLEAAAELLERLGRYEEAHSLLAGVVEGRTAKGSKQSAGDRIRILRKLGTLSHRTGHVATALKQLRRCVSRSAESASAIESFQARVELALLHHFRGEVDRALDLSHGGVEIWKRASRDLARECLESAVHLHAILGQIHIRALRFQEAISTLEQGLRLAEKSGSRLNTSVLLNNLGLAHHLAGEFTKALKIFQRAEAMAAELEDIGALASIRCNTAQILTKKGRFREASSILNELEESPAVQQSLRMRLHLVYSRGLLLNLLRTDAEEVWTGVQELSAGVGDFFLQRLARIYTAEGRITCGHHSTARPLLECGRDEWKADPVVASLKTARRALLEALTGHDSLSRKLRRQLAMGGSTKGDRKKPPRGPHGVDIPDQLLAWNRYHAGLAAMETGDLDEALQEVGAARSLFHRMGYVVGELECDLAQADLLLRARGQRPVSLRDIERCIRRARDAAVQAVSDASPRQRDVRTALLEARLLLTRLLPGHPDLPSGDSRRRKKTTPVPTEAVLARMSDLLARAAGDSAATSDPEHGVLVDVLTACAARIRGERAAAREAAARVRHGREQIAATLDTQDREAFLERDPWAAQGFADLRSPRGDAPLEGRHADALASALLEFRPDGIPGRTPEARSRLEATLERIGQAVEADRVEIVAGGRLVAGWSSPGRPKGGKPQIFRDSLAAPLPRAEPGVGFLRVLTRSRGKLTDSDGAFLDAVAMAVGGVHGHSEMSRSSAGAARADSEGTSRGHEPTKDLPQTRTLALPKPGTEALARFLEEEGFVVCGPFRKLLRTVHAYSASDLPVLITGESGVGKNVLARMLHRLSPRREGPFLVQNAGAVPRELFEADLFGYESGAFTSAERTRTGFLFRAEGGTFHIEEVGDLDLTHQQLLLRVIEEKAVRPLGAPRPRPIDVRFLASTHRDIDAMVRSGDFRRDLFFRLNAARVHVPPLRERLEEIPVLVRHLWRELTGSVARFSRSAMDAFLQHDWPGNIRELLSVLRRMSLDSEGIPTPGDVRAAVGKSTRRPMFPPEMFLSTPYDELRGFLEEAYLQHLFTKHEGELEAIASELGTTTRSIYRRFERLGLRPKDFKRRSR